MSRLALLAIFPLLVLAALVALARYSVAAIRRPADALRIAVMLDETANVTFNGRVNETLSHRAARARNGGRRWGCVLCRLLDAAAPHHCDQQLKKP